MAPSVENHAAIGTLKSGSEFAALAPMSPSASALILPLALLMACAAPEPVDDFHDESRMDGFEFKRDLKPRQIELDSLDQAQFNEDQYISYELNLAASTEVQITSSFGIWQILENIGWNAINLRESFRVTHVLFAYDNLSEEWDLVTKHQGRRFNVDLDKGRYLFLILASQESYIESVPLFTEIASRKKLSVEAGNFQLRVLTHEGLHAANLRVALGTSSGYTDESGAVVLKNIPRGEYELKFGEQGLQRADDLRDIFVLGKRLTQKRALILGAGDYAKWKQ